MLKELKNTIRQSAVYGLSRVAAKLVSFILIPLYTATFTSDIIANINLLESFWQYIFTIGMFAFETAIINFCAREDSEVKRKKILSSFLFLLVFNSVLIILSGIIFSRQFSEIILKEQGLSDVIFYCFLISAFEALLIMPLTIARLNNKPGLYTVITVSNLLINLILQLVFLVFLDLDFRYIFLAKFIAPALMFFIFLPYVLKNLKFDVDFDEIKSILKFSFPLMLAMLVSLLLNTVDRFILSEYVSKLDVAIYTTGYSLGSITNAFMLSPFTLAINVIFWKKINDDNFGRFMTKSSTYLFSAMIFASLIISLFVFYGIKIFVRNEALWPAVNIIPFILFANCFVALFTFHSLDFYHKRNTNIILYIMTACLAFNFIANIVFIKYYGIYASAVITVLSGILMLIFGQYMTRKISFTKFEINKIFLLSALFIIFVSAAFYFRIENVYIDISIKLLLIFLFIFIIYIFKFFEPIEIERIKGFFNKYLFRKLR